MVYPATTPTGPDCCIAEPPTDHNDPVWAMTEAYDATLSLMVERGWLDCHKGLCTAMPGRKAPEYYRLFDWLYDTAEALGRRGFPVMEMGCETDGRMTPTFVPTWLVGCFK